MSEFLVQVPAQLSEHLRSLRRFRGLTQAEAARKLGIKQARYNAIENNPLSVSAGQLLDVLALFRTDLLIRMRPAKRVKSKGEDW